MRKAFQKSINRMPRSSLGALYSTPVAFLQAEGGGPTAGDLRDQAGLDDTGGRIRVCYGQPPDWDGGSAGGFVRQRVEVSSISLGRSFPGVVELPPECVREEMEEQVRAAIERPTEKEKDPDTIWTDGLRLESGGVGAGIAWYEEVAESEQGGSVVFWVVIFYI